MPYPSYGFLLAFEKAVSGVWQVSSATWQDITHRIVSKTGNAVITQGDANNTQDSPITEGDIVGKVVSVWRGFGSVVNFLRTPLGLFSVLAGGVVLWLLTDLLTGAFGKKDEQED